MTKPKQSEKRLEDASMDELIAVIDMCEYLYWTAHEDMDDKAWDKLMKTYRRAVEILKTKYHLDDEGIRRAWEDWNERMLRKEWEKSYCSKCPRSPGFESYKLSGGTLSCDDPKGTGSTILYHLPRTKEECPLERRQNTG